MKEIKKLPKSLGFDGFLNGNVVTYGCRSFLLEDYQKLYDVLVQFGLESYRIPKIGEIKTEELAEIIRVAKS
jgi:hypothetical protein